MQVQITLKVVNNEELQPFQLISKNTKRRNQHKYNKHKYKITRINKFKKQISEPITITENETQQHESPLHREII